MKYFIAKEILILITLGVLLVICEYFAKNLIPLVIDLYPTTIVFRITLWSIITIRKHRLLN